MMLRFVLILTLFWIGFVIGQSSTPACPVNEVYQINTLTCETSCEDKDVNYVQECQRSQPFTGCVCQNNYYRDGQGNCVTYNECPTFTCNGTDEVPNNCAAAEPCRKNCYNRFRPLPIRCPAICVKACTCRVGYLKNNDGVCVPINECSPPRCNENEQYNRCGTACETKCSNYNETNQICTEQCVEGCFCVDGYVRVDNTQQCSTIANCPAPSS